MLFGQMQDAPGRPPGLLTFRDGLAGFRFLPVGFATTVDAGAPEDEKNPAGIDVSSYQQEVEWTKWTNRNVRFVYVKATEGTGYRSDTLQKQVTRARSHGLIVGTYHYARPDLSSGRAEARYFVQHGGRWQGGTRTLPGALDIEQGGTKGACFGMSNDDLAKWVREFVTEYRQQTGVHPVIYTNAAFWRECIGAAGEFSENPLWLAQYDTDAPHTIPAGWPEQTMWQHTSKPVDQNIFNGTLAQLEQWAATGSLPLAKRLAPATK